MVYDLPRTRAWNLRLQRPTPYPLGQQAKLFDSKQSSNIFVVRQFLDASHFTKTMFHKDGLTITSATHIYSSSSIKHETVVSKQKILEDCGMSVVSQCVRVEVTHTLSLRDIVLIEHTIAHNKQTRRPDQYFQPGPSTATCSTPSL